MALVSDYSQFSNTPKRKYMVLAPEGIWIYSLSTKLLNFVIRLIQEKTAQEVLLFRNQLIFSTLTNFQMEFLDIIDKEWKIGCKS